jgi:hypothetical protein
MTSEDTIHDSDSITRTKTALVLDLADGRTVELTAHVATPRDDGLRGMEPRDRKSETQAGFQAGPATLILRDLDGEDADPIGLLPVDLQADIDAPDDWRRLDDDEVGKRICPDPSILGPVFEHDSGEAWLQIERKFQDGRPRFRVYIEAGDPSSGIWPVEERDRGQNHDQVAADARSLMQNYDHDAGGDDD